MIFTTRMTPQINPPATVGTAHRVIGFVLTLMLMGLATLGVSRPAQAQTVWDVAGGYAHSCVVRDGKVFCLGFLESLGQGQNPPQAKSASFVDTPHEVSKANGYVNENIIKIASGYRHTCAIQGDSLSDTSGVLYCWGTNKDEVGLTVNHIIGVIGDGTTDTAYVPKKVSAAAGFTNTAVTDVVTGYRHTCAVEAGVMYCWGNNLSGPLGDGTGIPYSSSSTAPSTTAALVPVKVADNGDFVNNNIEAIAAGDRFSCAIRAGELFCWGTNNFGQLALGNQNLVAGHALPNKAVDNSVDADFVNANLTAVSAGQFHACAVGSKDGDTGRVWCWGWGSYGRLGLANASDSRYEATNVIINESGVTSNLKDVTQLDLGEDYSCALTNRDAPTTQKLYCWGRDGYGATGQGNSVGGSATFTGDENPSVVLNGSLYSSAFINESVQAFSAGRWHALAIQDDAMYSWGSNAAGQLGRGFPLKTEAGANTSAVSSPIPLANDFVVARDEDSINKLLAYDGTQTAPVFADYTAAGVPGAAEANLDAYNTALVGLDPTTIDEIDDMVAAYNKIIEAAGDATKAAALVAADYEALGLTLADANVLAFLNGAVADGVAADVDTWTEVSDLVAAANRIWAHAASQVGAETPLFSDYEALQLTGATSGNLVSYNSAVQAVATTTQDEVQTVVTSYNAILATANDLTASASLTGQQYFDLSVGMGGQALSGDALSVLNSSVGSQAKTASDTVPELQSMAQAADRIVKIAAGFTTQSLEVADFQALGIQGVTASNLAEVRTLIANAGAGSLTTVAEIISAIESALSDPAAVQALLDYDGTQTPPDGQLYSDAGVSGVDGSKLDGYNDYLKNADPQDLQGIQDLVDAFNKVEAAAGDDTASNALVEDDYSALGITLTDPGVLPFMNAIVANTTASGVDTYDELAALAEAANRIWAHANSVVGAETPLPEDYLDIGSQRFIQARVGAYNSGIQEVATQTPAEVQAVIDAYNLIWEAADGDATTPSTLTVDPFETLDVTVDPLHMGLINSILSEATSPQIDTVPKLRDLVGAAGKVIDTATDNSDAGLGLGDFEAMGLGNINPLRLEEAIERIAQADVSEVQTLEGLRLLLADLLLDVVAIPTLNGYALLMLALAMLLIFGWRQFRQF
jgi:alpha-tubulin suppressor-like RCC1 family protein